MSNEAGGIGEEKKGGSMKKKDIIGYAEYNGDLYIACGRALYRWDGKKHILVHTFDNPISALYATDNYLYISEKIKFQKLSGIYRDWGIGGVIY